MWASRCSKLWQASHSGLAYFANVFRASTDWAERRSIHCSAYGTVRRRGRHRSLHRRVVTARRPYLWASFLRSSMRLFDYLIRPQQDRLWDSQAERLGGLEVDDQLKLGGILDRQVRRLYPLQDFVHVVGGVPS